MDNFVFNLPTTVHFGRGVISSLGKESAKFGNKALLVYGKNSIKKYGIYDEVVKSLKENNISFIDHGGVKANPVLSHARKGIQIVKDNDIDFIIAVGGGSVIDESKSIAAGVKYSGDVWDFFLKKSTIEAAIPVIAVVTMPATSSEMNEWMVLTNEENLLKSAANSNSVIPKAAFLDPSITYTIPKKNTAYACSDILSHLLETYFSITTYCPVQEGIIEGIAKAVISSMVRVLEYPEDYQARASIMWAASLAWSHFPKTGIKAVARCHRLGHPLSGIYDIAHGATLSIVTPVWLEFAKKDYFDRILKFSENIMMVKGNSPEDTIDKGIQELKKWYTTIGTPITMTQANIDNPNIELLTEHVIKGLQLSNMNDFTKEELIYIFNKCK